MRISNVAQMFAEGETTGGTKDLFIEGNVIYSYGHHFPIAIRFSDGTIIFNKDGYSMSTSRHKNLVRSALNLDEGSSKTVFMNTDQMNGLIYAEIDTIAELIATKL
jgi:hypothetical protein